MLALSGIVTAVYLATVVSSIGLQQQPASLDSISSGCGVHSPWKFDSTHHSNRSIGDRSFYVHIPPSYNPNVPHAVVLSYYGYEEDDVIQEKISAFSQQGFLINNQV
jgi:hypothetical protein